MDPLTAGMSLLASLNALATAIINKAPADTVGDIITQHEARISRLNEWLEAKFKFLKLDPPPTK